MVLLTTTCPMCSSAGQPMDGQANRLLHHAQSSSLSAQRGLQFAEVGEVAAEVAALAPAGSGAPQEAPLEGKEEMHIEMLGCKAARPPPHPLFSTPLPIHSRRQTRWRERREGGSRDGDGRGG